MSSPGPVRPEPRGRRRTFLTPADAVALGAVSLALLVFVLAPYAIRGYRFPMGADAPVYLWWARLAGHDGLSAVGMRPGVPALSLVMGGTTGLSQPAALAGIEAAMACAAGLAAAAFVKAGRPSRGRAGWAVAGLLTGMFAANLADGYLAGLTFSALYVAALALLVAGTRRAAIAAALLLGAGGLAHPAYLALGGAVLLIAAVAGLFGRRDAGESARVVASVVGGAAVMGAGLALMLIGPGPPLARTSKDAFLRAAGLSGTLHHLFRQRLAQNWLRYLLPAYVPLAALGLSRTRGLEGRTLRAWGAVTIAGVAVGAATGLVPGERFLSFGFFLPVLGSLGLAVLWSWHRDGARAGRNAARVSRRTIPVLAGVITLVLVAGSVLAWRHVAQFLRPSEVRLATEASRVAAATPPGTTLVFLVDDPHNVGFEVPRRENTLRSAMPPSRIRNVHVYVGSPARYLMGRPTLTGNPLHDEMSRLYLREIERVKGPSLAIVLAPMDRPWVHQARTAGDEIFPGVIVLGRHPAPAAVPPDALAPSPTWNLVLAGVATLVLLFLVGLGWARAAAGPGMVGMALAPALGAAGLILAGVVVDRMGLRLTGPASPVVTVVVAAAGFLVARRNGGLRRLRGDTAHAVEGSSSSEDTTELEE